MDMKTRGNPESNDSDVDSLAECQNGGGTTTTAEVLTTAVVLDLSDHELKRNRTFMTIAHFMLTYPRWSFSLFLLLASASLPKPLPTVQQAIQRPIQNLQALVKSESRAYHECTAHYFDSTQRALNETAAIEWEKSRLIRQQNVHLLETNASVTVDACVRFTRTAQRAFSQWYRQHQQQQQNQHREQERSTHVLVPWMPRKDNKNSNKGSHCTAKDRHDLIGSTALIYDNQQAKLKGLTHQVNDELNTWRTRALDTATRLANYAQNRSSYDYNYFIGVKSNVALQRLREWHVKVAAVNLPTFSEQHVLDQLRALLQALQSLLQEAKVRIDLLETRLQSFFVSLQSFRVNYLDLYRRLSLASAFVKDFLPPRMALPSYLDMSSVPVVDLLLPSVFEMPQFDVDFELPAHLMDMDHILASLLESIQRAVAGLMEHVSDAFQELLRELLESLQELFLLNDYDPPRYHGQSSNSMDEELQTLDESNQATKHSVLQMLRDSLNDTHLDHLQHDEDDVANSSLPLDIESLEFPNVDGGNTTSFAYLEPAFPSFAIPEVIEAIVLFVIAHQWVVEVVIQFFRILRLKQKYEQDATPDLPEIDLVSNKNGEADERYSESTWSLIQSALLEHLLTPWMILGLVLFPFAFVGVIWWFPHVKHSCIDTRNGTFLARNMIAPILINKASIAGNSYHTAAEFQCRRTQRTICTSKFRESDQLHKADLHALQALVSKYNESATIRDTFQRCINLNALDASFSSICCGLKGYTPGCVGPGDPELCPIDNDTVPPSAFLPIGKTLNEAACPVRAQKFWNLQDSRFDCNGLYSTRDGSVCSSPTCVGVDAARLEWTTVETDCEVETYIVKCCLLVLVALYHGIMVNLISSLAFNGVKRLRWRNLRPDGITFRTNVAEDGRLVRGGNQQDRLDRIQRALGHFQLVGEVQLAFSCSLFVAWLLSFVVLRQLLWRVFSI